LGACWLPAGRAAGGSSYASNATKKFTSTSPHATVVVSKSAGMVISSTSKSSEWAISLCLIPGRLVDGRAGDQSELAVALVLEDRPALQHVDELEAERMGVTGRIGMLARLGADHVRADLAAGQLLETERTVFEERPEPVGLVAT
jgi:hypothetical protein